MGPRTSTDAARTVSNFRCTDRLRSAPVLHHRGRLEMDQILTLGKGYMMISADGARTQTDAIRSFSGHSGSSAVRSDAVLRRWLLSQSGATRDESAARPNGTARARDRVAACGPVAVILDPEVSASTVEWAAAEASALGTRLKIVAVPGSASDRSDHRSVDDAGAEIRLRHAARDLLDGSRSRISDLYPGLRVAGTVGKGDVITIANTECGDAELIVVGTDLSHRTALASRGSVVLDLMATSRRPVVMVHPGDRYRSSGDIVVGLDGSEQDLHMLTVAAVQASRSGGDLLCVHADVPGRDRSELSSRAHVRTCAQLHPELHIRTVEASGSAVEVLTAASSRARLLVVGSSDQLGERGSRGTVVGLLANAHLPVMIVPASSSRRAVPQDR